MSHVIYRTVALLRSEISMTGNFVFRIFTSHVFGRYARHASRRQKNINRGGTRNRQTGLPFLSHDRKGSGIPTTSQDNVRLVLYGTTSSCKPRTICALAKHNKHTYTCRMLDCQFSYYQWQFAPNHAVIIIIISIINTIVLVSTVCKMACHAEFFWMFQYCRPGL